MTDLNEALVRPSDEPGPAPKKPRKSLVEGMPVPVIGAVPVAPPVAVDPVAAAFDAVQAENAELKARLDRMEQLLMALAPAAAPAPVKRDELDLNRPYSKTRTMGGGVTFEQDGRKFNARGQLMTEA